MKTARYVRAERSIVKADAGGIRERWLWGLRLLHDPTAMSAGGGGLRHGVAAELIAASGKAGVKLSDREVQYRLQCARAYQTEGQIRTACSDFGSWSELRAAGFPPIAAHPDEDIADWRTASEIAHDLDQELVQRSSGQTAFSFFQDHDPATATLVDLQRYTAQQEELSRRFMDHSARRRAYLEELIVAADGEMSTTWEQAHRLARPEEDL